MAQTVVSPAAPDAVTVGAARERVASQIAEAAARGARLVCFPEGTLAYPGKRIMSRQAPELGEADWGRADWDALAEAVRAIQRDAARHGVWVVVGAPHRLSAGTRPHNSLYVISDRGDLVTRYDKRFLSTNEAAYLYTPGTEAIVVEVDGVHIGFLVCLEALFPELFLDYADRGADVVLLASAPDPNFGRLASAHAFMTGLTIGVAFGASTDTDAVAVDARSGICAWHGWLARADDPSPSIVVAEVERTGGTHEFQRRARSGEIYAGLHAPDDPRSRDRTAR